MIKRNKDGSAKSTSKGGPPKSKLFAYLETSGRSRRELIKAEASPTTLGNPNREKPSTRQHKHEETAQAGPRHERKHTIDYNDDAKMDVLVKMAIKTFGHADDVTGAPDPHHTGKPNKLMRAKSGSSWEAETQHLDQETIKDLEHILKDAQEHTIKHSSTSDGNDHNRLDVSTHRAQKKRITHLEEILKHIHPYKTQDFDPVKMLECRYLRLSERNVEELERMAEEKGEKPAFHAFTKVTDINVVWDGLKEDREKKENEKIEKTKGKERAVSPNHARVAELKRKAPKHLKSKISSTDAVKGLHDDARH